MKKIAVIINSIVVGGHEFQTLELIKDLSKDNDVDILVDTSLDLEKSKLNSLKNKVISLKIYYKGCFLLQLIHSFFLRKTVKPLLHDYDFVIVSGGSIEATIALGYALKNMNIYSYVPSFVDRSKLWHNKIGNMYNTLNYLFCKPYKRIITINRIQSKLLSHYKKTIVIPNRIISEKTNLTCVNNRKESFLYFIGRLEKPKGILELAKMLDCPENPYKKFLIVGDGSQFKELKQLSLKTQHIELELLGWLSKEQQDQIFNSSDVYITNSYAEGEPLAISEANHRDSIVIASDIAGHRGCVAKKNRFSNKKELIEKLILAKQGKLGITKNYTFDEIESFRRAAIKEICL